MDQLEEEQGQMHCGATHKILVGHGALPSVVPHSVIVY